MPLPSDPRGRPDHVAHWRSLASGLRRGFPGEIHSDGGALTFGALQCDFAMVHKHDGLGDRQSEPEAPHFVSGVLRGEIRLPNLPRFAEGIP
jgi:hypothetical protein